MAVGKGRTVAIVRGAVAFHLDDDVLRVGFGFARDGERSDARHGVFLGKSDVHRFVPFPQGFVFVVPGFDDAASADENQLQFLSRLFVAAFNDEGCVDAHAGSSAFRSSAEFHDSKSTSPQTHGHSLHRMHSTSLRSASRSRSWQNWHRSSLFWHVHFPGWLYTHAFTLLRATAMANKPSAKVGCFLASDILAPFVGTALRDVFGLW